MLKHYLATASRHYSRHKFTTAINVLGLALGLITFAVAYGIAKYNSSGDLYHEKAARTYVLMQKMEVASSQWSSGFAPNSGIAVGPLLKNNFPSLELVARVTLPQEMATAASDKQSFSQVSFADPEFLEVFDLDFVVGDRRAALRAPASAVIRDEVAMQLWGRLNVIGETLLLNNKARVVVSGVIRAPREPSHMVNSAVGGGLGFSMLVSMDTRSIFFADYDQSITYPDFTVQSAHTYVVIPAGDKRLLSDVSAGLASFGAQHLAPRFGKAKFTLRPVSQIRQANIERAMGISKLGLSPTTAYLLVGALVLLVACLNYANLAAAHATTRTKELAMLRVVGATRGQIALQSFIEALLLVVIAAALALIALPFVGAALKVGIGMDIRPVLFQSLEFTLVWVVTVITTATVACIYPAMVMARIRPAQALQSSRPSHTQRTALQLLVITQLTAASVLLISSSLMRSQNDMLWQFAAKLQADPIVIIGNDLHDVGVTPQLLKTELRKQAAVKSVSAVFSPPGAMGGEGDFKLVMTNAEASSRHWLAFRPVVDSEFFATMDIPLLAGRNFSKDIATDVGSGTWYGNGIIDRALAAQYGWPNPQDAIGKQIFLPTGAGFNAVGKSVTVIGVVENRTLFPFALLGSNSTFYSYADNESLRNLLVRIPKQHLEEGLQAIDKVWHELVPGVPIKRRFVDEQFEIAYRQVNALATSSSFTGVLTFFVAAMGLLGIATHSIAQRTFEIGVRRTLGASVRQVLTMLLRDFSKPVIIANLVAWPLAYGAALLYRARFTEHAPITVTPFILSLVVGISIACLAVLKQSIKAARMNPATVLRYE